MALDSLTDRETEMLDLEEQWFATASGKEGVIDEQLGLRLCAITNSSTGS